MRVLVVEDSVRLQESIAAALRRTGYATDVAGDGEEGWWQVQQNDYDVLVLDIMLPKLDGLEVLARLRASGRETPVLMLTARDTVEDRVRGLSRGADDYLIKPFALEELLARVQALCRRKYGTRSTRVAVGELVIDTSARRAMWGENQVELTAREYALLEFLAVRRGAVVSRTQIEEHIYDGMVDPMSNVVDSTICILRRKLADAGARPIIHTRRGQGYVLEADSACTRSAGN